MKQDLKQFEYKISLGQNFIFDEALLADIVQQTGITMDDTILEIGAGRGDLSIALARQCKELVTLEIDARLETVLRSRFEEFDNISLHMVDVMKTDLAQLMEGKGPFHVVSNLPYYLTTPILNLLLHSKLPLLGIHVMVQKEAAERIFARPDTPEYGPLALAVAYKTAPREALFIPAKCFTPPPKVDSVFVTMPYHHAPPVRVEDEDLFSSVIQTAFAMRRKTLANNLAQLVKLPRQQVLDLLSHCGLPEKIRGEALDLPQFAALSNAIKRLII